jgi:hypothetical protein
MPYIFIFTSPEAKKKIYPHFERIARKLREVTANTLPDLGDDPMKVSVCLITWDLGQNMADAVALGIASENPLRQRCLDNWQKIMLKAIETFLKEDDPASKDLKNLQFEAYPTMPPASWGRARKRG